MTHPTVNICFDILFGAVLHNILVTRYSMKQWLGGYTLQQHQQRAVDRIVSPHNRGVILYFATGAGKSLSSIAAAETLMAANSTLSVVFVAPAALLINFANELRKYGVDPKPYTLLSLHGFIKEYDHRNRDADKVKKLHGRILIVDEAHNLRNTASTISQVVVRAAASAHKVLALSGTPIQNRPCEIAPLLCMIKPHCVPLTQAAFEERFGVSGLDANREQLKKALHCTICHYKPLSENPDYPTLSVREVLVSMHPQQVKAHLQAIRDLPPTDFEDLANSKNLMAFLNGPRRISNGVVSSNHMYAAKLEELVRRVAQGVADHHKSIVYSSFLEYGVNVIKHLLNQQKIPYAVITGEQSRESKEKARIAYNTRQVMVLIFSKAGSEGLTLQDTTYVHVAEPGWSDANIQQVIGRSRRLKSHSGKYGSKVTVYKYLSVMPPPSSLFSKAKRFVKQIGIANPLETMTADQVLATLSNRKEQINQRFMKACVQWGNCNN